MSPSLLGEPCDATESLSESEEIAPLAAVNCARLSPAVCADCGALSVDTLEEKSLKKKNEKKGRKIRGGKALSVDTLEEKSPKKK